MLRLLRSANRPLEITEIAERLGVHHCPFLELATARPDVVCPCAWA